MKTQTKPLMVIAFRLVSTDKRCESLALVNKKPAFGTLN